MRPLDSKKKTIRVIDLPGIRTLEDRLLIYGGDVGRCEDLVAEVSRKLFGIADWNTRYKPSAELADEMHYSVLSRMRAANEEYEHEQQFETGDLPDDAILEVMDRFGFDFRDDRGQPLRCSKLMCRPAEAAAKGIAGKMPEQRDVELRQFEDGLTRSREEFLAAKRKSRPHREHS